MTKKIGINMDDLYRFYNDIYSELPFSIRGYNNLEGQVNAFFNNLMTNSLFKQKDNIQFLSYSYAKLEDIDTWKLENFSSRFFWHAVNETYSDILLSFYFYAAQKITSNEEGSELLTANILANLFVNDCSFRLRYSTGRDWSFRYAKSKNVFTVEVPLTRFFNVDANNKDPYGQIHNLLERFVHDIIWTEEELGKCLIIARDKNSQSNIFKKTSSENINEFEKNSRCGCLHHTFFNDLFIEKQEREGLIENLVTAVEYFHKSHPGFFNTTNTHEYIEDWVRFFFPVCFISIAYNCWIEYMPAVCGYSSVSDTYRNLGGILVGYDFENELTKDERTIFKMISEKISSAIAANKMHDFLEIDLIRQASECFGIEGVSELVHGQQSRYSKDNALKYAEKQCQKLLSRISRIRERISFSTDYLKCYSQAIEGILGKIQNTDSYNGLRLNDIKVDHEDHFKFDSEQILNVINENDDTNNIIIVKDILGFGNPEFHLSPTRILKNEIAEMIRKAKEHNNEDIYATVFTTNDDKTIRKNENYNDITEQDNYIVFFHKLNGEPDNSPEEWEWTKSFGRIIPYLGVQFHILLNHDSETNFYDWDGSVPNSGQKEYDIIKEKLENNDVLQRDHAIYLLKMKTLTQQY